MKAFVSIAALLFVLVWPATAAFAQAAEQYSTRLEFRPRNYAMRENERSLVRLLVRSLVQRGAPFDLVVAARGDLAARRLENVESYLRELGVRGKITSYDLSKGDSPLRLLFDDDEVARRATLETLSRRDPRLFRVATVLVEREGPESAVLMLDPASPSPVVAH